MPDFRTKWRALLEAIPHRRTLTVAAVVGLLCLAALGAGFALGSWRTVCHDCPSIAQIYVWEPQQSTKILSHDGQVLAELFRQRRTPIALAALPDYVPQAFIAIEDKRFYQHHGFDLRGIARAAVNMVLQGEIAGGGSTITQQLARHMWVEELGFEQRFRRKLKELKVAIELEKVYTKELILEAYINQVNYGRGHYGIESAAQWFFGKSATEVNPAEAALLAAVINLPEYYSPFKNPEAALQRRNLVLRLMAEQGYLSREDAERWMREPLPEDAHTNDEGAVAPYFVEWVRRMLDDRYGPDLYRKGYRIYTSLDLEMQRRAREAMERGWLRIEGDPRFTHATYAEIKEKEKESEKAQAAAKAANATATPYLQGMLIALEPETGEIRAMVGGRDFDDSKFNRALQALRQPGSVFKPFVYTAAIASRIPASHVIYDAPLMIPQQDGTMWTPSNYSGDFKGPLTLREALRRSVNIVAVKLAMEVGLETVVQYARRMGIRTPIQRVPAIAIGAAATIPIQVAEAYTVFATQGFRTTPRAILRVEDAEGRVLWETQPERERVLDPLTASIMLDLLRDVVDHGTAYNAVRDTVWGPYLPYDVPAAGKTGTTNDYTNVWFVGFTPDLLAAVWLGFDTPETITPGATGGGFAAPIWSDFMSSIYVGENALRTPPEPWSMPAELTTRRIDSETGKLATEWCDPANAYTEYFIPGTEPTEACGMGEEGLFGAPLGGFRQDLLPPPDTMQRDTLRLDTLRLDTLARDTIPRG
ncbi:MAG TPA: PBP1A family penicillin-binding protein [Longimicrobiales bacterium]